MAEFKLGRLKFVWKGDWASGATYVKDDIIRNGGKSYVCTQGHVSASLFTTDAAFWDIMNDGFVWRSTWHSNEYYNVNDVVKFGANAYICTAAHTSATNFATDELGNWERFVEGQQFEDSWSSSTQYQNGDTVSYGGYTYIALKTNTNVNPATNVQDPGISDKTWNLHSIGYRNRSTWNDSAQYLTGDVVQHGGNTYVCVKDNSSETPPSNTTYWTLMLSGQRPVGVWDGYVDYKINDIVQYGGNLYIAIADSTAETPSADPSIYWDLYLQGYKIIGIFDDSAAYKAGEVVQYGGNTYVALVDTSNTPADETDWQLLTAGIKWNGAWTLGATYKVNDAIKYGTTSYICIEEHTSTNGSDRPDNDSTETYWNALSEGDVSNAFAAEGDLLYYGTTSTQNLAIGTARQILQVDTAGTAPEWTDTPQLSSLEVLESITVDDAGNGGNIILGQTASGLLVQESDNEITTDIVSASKVGATVTFTYTDGTAVDLIPVSVTAWDVEITGASVTALNGTWGIRDFDKTANTFTITIPALDGSGSGSVSLSGATITLLAPAALTDTTMVVVNNQNGFIQSALKNLAHGTSASADFIVYADNGDNDSGWIDMGITSSGFDASSGFGITDINDGYIFMSAPENTTGPGNLVIATDNNGTENDIVFCTGGFDITTNTDAEKVRIIGESRIGTPAGVVIAIDTESTSPTTGALRVQGGMGLQGSLYLEGEVSAFGGAIYQGRKDLGGGLFQNARELINDVGIFDVEPEVSSITWSGTTVSLVYTVGATNLTAATTSDEIHLDHGLTANWPSSDWLGAWIITGNNTGTRTITFEIPTLTSTGTVTLTDQVIQLFKENYYVGLTDASGIFTGDADSFVQFALKNHNAGQFASTDFILYTSDGDNDAGWMDMGITSEGYDDPTFGVTGPNDGYIFMSAPEGTTGAGDLFISTSGNGTQNDIVFSTGGFEDSSFERMRIVGTDRVGTPAGVIINIPTQSLSPTTGALRVDGGIGLQGNLNVGGNVNIVGTISIGGSGSSLETSTLSVADPMIRMGTGNSTDTIDLGFYGTYSSASTQLDGALNNSATTITVDSTAAFPAAGSLIVDSEEISYTGKTATTFTGCTRGANTTTAASHLDNAVIFAQYFAGLVRNQSLAGSPFVLFKDLQSLAPKTTISDSATLAELRLGSLTVVDSTASTTSTSGAVVITGGLGIGGAINGGSTATFSSGIQNTRIGNVTRGSGAFTTLAANDAATFTSSAQVDGLITLSTISEKTEDKTAATGVVTHDFATTDIWYHSSMSANFTANFTNVPTTVSRVLSATLFLAQGATARLPTAVQIDGVAQSIRWAGNVQPTPVANKTEIVVFTLIRTAAGAWVVLGQLSSYG